MNTAFESLPSQRQRVGGCGRPSGRQIAWAIVFFSSASIGMACLHYLSIPSVLRYLTAAFPVLAGVQYVRALVGDMRRQVDELQLRIYMEAAIVVVCGLFIVMVAYPLLEAVHVVGKLDSLMVIILILGLGAVGYASGVRRYR